MRTRADAVVAALLALATGVLLALLLARAGTGFEFSDEGYYLAWIATPGAWTASASQFGFVYHPLYLLADGDIATLRRLNLLLTFALGAGLFGVLLQGIDGSRVLRAAVAGALGCGALVMFHTWLVTPNYNSLVLQGMLLAATGLAGMARAQGRWPLFAVLVALGGVTVFLAKPTTAALLGVIALPVLLCAGPVRWRATALAVATAALMVLVATVTIDGSPPAYAQRLLEGAAQMRLSGAGYALADLLRLDDFELPARERDTLRGAFAAMAVLALLATTSSRIARGIAALGSLLIAGYAAWLATVPPMPPPSVFLGLQLSAAGAAGLLVAAWPRRDAPPWQAHEFALGVGCALFPWAIAIGTNNNTWLVAANAAVFWVAAGIALMRLRLPPAAMMRAVLPIAGGTLAIAAAVLAVGANHPYRQPLPLAAQDREVTLGPRASVVRMTPAYADYLEALAAAARDHGFAPGTAVLDLTGQSPATVFALGGVSPGTPWWAGGYPGSDALARHLLDDLDCPVLVGAWLLVEPAGPRSLSPALLESFGAQPGRDYRIAAEVIVPAGVGGYTEPRVQRLLAPLRGAGEAGAACRAARQARVN